MKTNIDPRSQVSNRQVIEIAAEEGLKVFIVGGYLRDSLLGYDTATKDFDYIVQGRRAKDFAQLVSQKLQGHFVLLDEEFDTARVVLESGIILDFAGCMGGSLEADLKRRDFTVNAIAWDPQAPEKIIDLVGGIDDLKTRTIRAISENNLCDDPLRVLRAFRFAATLGGTIESNTLHLIKRHAQLLANVATERINYELFLTLNASPVSNLVNVMSAIGILETLFPEMTAMREVTPNAYHHLGLFEHSLELVNQLEEYLPKLPLWVHESLKSELAGGVCRLSATKLACLLHDLGKPSTWNITPEGRHTFYGHDQAGAQMVETIADRLHWARPVGRFIIQLVRWHLRPGQLFHQGPPTLKSIHRFYRTAGDTTPELILLALADLGATRGEGLPGREELEQNLLQLLNDFPVFQEQQRVKPKLLDGQAIMQLLSIPPGPIVGQLLEALDEASGLQEVTSKVAAENFVRELYKQLTS